MFKATKIIRHHIAVDLLDAIKEEFGCNCRIIGGGSFCYIVVDNPQVIQEVWLFVEQSIKPTSDKEMANGQSSNEIGRENSKEFCEEIQTTKNNAGRFNSLGRLYEAWIGRKA